MCLSMIRSFHDAMAMAKSLRHALGRREMALTHGDVLEIVAEQLGFKDWQVMSTRMEKRPAVAKARKAAPRGRLRFERAIPILRIFSAEKAKEFYVDYLGFALDWQSEGPPLYAQISRAGLVLHLSEHHGDGTPGTTVQIATRGLDRFADELAAKHYPFSLPLIDEVPAGKTAALIDPFGNTLRFSETKPAA
jgi:catechol 2,3-dioxygenase-like lactoylglutathione lyase family enzyme